MPRAIWSGAISFGLVNVPVKVYTAVQQRDVRFHQLHEKDGVRLQYKRWCPADEEEVSYDEIVKGYEVAPGEYVVIEPEELENLDPEATRTIDIEDFVDLGEIDPVFFQKPYFLVPAAGGTKAYRVLLEAMAEANRVAIARVVLRTKQYLVALRVSGDAIMMFTLNYADEVVAQDTLDGLPGAEAEVTDRERTMAGQLIEALTTSFEPGRYRDEYRDRVMALIEAKAEGREVVTPVAPTEPSLVVDLMAALEQSLKSASSGREGAAASSGNGRRRSKTTTPDRVTGSKARGKEQKAEQEEQPAGRGKRSRKRQPA